MARPDHYMRAGTTQIATPNNNSGAWANPFNSRYVRIYSPTADCFVKFGTSAPTAAATDFPIVAGIPEYLDIGDGVVYGAAFCATSVNVYITPMK